MSERSLSPRHRKHLRLCDYDYRGNGYYFVTVFTKDRKPYVVEEKGSISILVEVG